MRPLAEQRGRHLLERLDHVQPVGALDRHERRDRDDERPAGDARGHARVRVLEHHAARRVDPHPLRREEVRVGERLGALPLVAGNRRREHLVPDLVQDSVVDGLDQPAPGGRHQRARHPGVLEGEQQLARTGAPLDRPGAQVALHRVEQQRHHRLVRERAPGVPHHVVDRRLERAADQLGLVLGPPGDVEPGHDLGLGVVPEVLGHDERAVHVEHDGVGQVEAHVALKYFASGWCTISAEVDCSGCSWNSSESSTPMRSGSRRSTSTACISTSGQAG